MTALRLAGASTARRRFSMDKRRVAAFRKRLEEKQQELTSFLSKARDESRAMGAEDSGDQGEEATLAYNRDMLYSQSDTGHSLLKLVEEALERIEDGEFGICEECGRSIGMKRIDAVPWTPYCRDCQEEAERKFRAPFAR